jgi:hypothetical protein
MKEERNILRKIKRRKTTRISGQEHDIKQTPASLMGLHPHKIVSVLTTSQSP